MVDSFIGALPEPAVRQWVASLSPPPSEADRLVAAGDEASLRQALELEPANEQAVLALASLLVDRSEGDEALALLARIPETAEIRRIAALARVGDDVSGAAGGDVEAKLDGLLDRVKDDERPARSSSTCSRCSAPTTPGPRDYRKELTARLF